MPFSIILRLAFLGTPETHVVGAWIHCVPQGVKPAVLQAVDPSVLVHVLCLANSCSRVESSLGRGKTTYRIHRRYTSLASSWPGTCKRGRSARSERGELPSWDM
jgi:hypothetical protein